MRTETCTVCDQPSDVANVDLLALLCYDHQDAFDAWADNMPDGGLYADWLKVAA